MIDLSSKAFIFDMDGTLVDNMHVHADAWRILLEENGVAMDEYKFLVATAGRTNREIIPECSVIVQKSGSRNLRQKREPIPRSFLAAEETDRRCRRVFGRGKWSRDKDGCRDRCVEPEYGVHFGRP